MTAKRAPFKVGDRVEVTPDDQWTAGAQRCLRGVGVISEVQTAHNNGREHVPITPRYAVTFDVRPKPWAANQTPSRTWWFAAHELEQTP